MRSPRPALIANLCWLAAVAAAAGGIAWRGPARIGIGIAVIAAGIALAVNLYLGHRDRKRQQVKLEMLSLAVGAESATVEGIVAGLTRRLDRANAFKAAFIEASRPALLGGPDGKIISASEGFLALEPEFDEGANLDSLFGPEFLETGQLLVGGIPFVAQVQTLAGGRALVELSAAGRLVSDDQLAAFGASLEKLDAVALTIELLLEEKYDAAETTASGLMKPLVERFRSLAEDEREDTPRLAMLESKTAAMLTAIDSYRSAIAEIARHATSGRTGATEAQSALAQGSMSADTIAETGSSASRLATDAGDAASRAHRAADGLNTVTSEIDKMVAGIEEISFRTNLLALNAAVEAARAGEKGAGFAVVADEVRSLAQGATKTARDIRSLVADSRKHAGTGLEAVEELTKLLASLDGHLLNLGENSTTVGAAIATGSAALDRLGTSTAAIGTTATEALRLPARKPEAAGDAVAPRAAGGRA